MQSDNGNTPAPGPRPPAPDGEPPAAATAADPGLPPVAPPSAKFILQLFLVPGLIIATAVGVWLLWRFLFGAPLSAEQFLRRLDDDNPEVRWRAAEDLAQALPRNDQLTTDVGFGLSLAERLKKAGEAEEASERAYADQRKRSKDGPPPPPRALQEERKFVLYLTSSLGYFRAPVGAPLLRDLALKGGAGDAETVFRRRANAVWSLTLLGNALEKFDKLDGWKKKEMLARLGQEADAGGDRGAWARQALAYLEDREAGRPSAALGVGDALVECARADAPFLREQAAAALTFWGGPRVEEALVRLADDDGRGRDPVERDEQQERYRKEHPDEVRRQAATRVRYNAVLTLARRGSARVKDFFGLLGEMLDEGRQREVWGSEEPRQKGSSEADARQVVIYTLQALGQLRRRKPDVDLSPLKPAVHKLADSPHAAVSAEATELLKKLD